MQRCQCGRLRDTGSGPAHPRPHWTVSDHTQNNSHRISIGLRGDATRFGIASGITGPCGGGPVAARAGRQQVAQLVALGVEVSPPLRQSGAMIGNLVDDLQVVTIIDKRVGLLRVVGQEADPGEPQVLEDLQADAVIAQVGPVAQSDVGLDGIQSLVLEVVGPDLLDQPMPRPS